MPATYEPIATTTLSSTASSISFTSITSAYTDIRLVFTGTYSSAGGTLAMTFNSDTGANYSYTALSGNGSTAVSFRSSGDNYIDVSATGAVNTTVGMHEINVFSYAGSTNKTVLIGTSVDKNGSGNVGRQVGLWRSTSAITSITLSLTGQTFASGTTATLYGILKA